MKPDETNPSIPSGGLPHEQGAQGFEAPSPVPPMTPQEQIHIEQMIEMERQAMEEEQRRNADLDMLSMIVVYDVWDDLGM